jgi:Fe-S-cluster containining protein
VTALGHSLPVIGAGHLDFRCNGCGACCRSLRVSVTHHDLRRLLLGGHGTPGQTAALGEGATALVDWLAPEAVDMTGEPGSFVELSAGRRLMVLAWREGACSFLDATQRCRAYASRPRDCRLFPFDLARDAAGSVVSVARLELEGCGDERGPSAALSEIDRLDRQRWDELGEYQALVARWNRLARHRRRFRQPAGEAAAFLAWLGLEGAASGVGDLG